MFQWLAIWGRLEIACSDFNHDVGLQVARRGIVFSVWNVEVREALLTRFGLIFFWAKVPKIGARMINARAKTVAEKPAFRNALKRRRWLVLADGCYEWQKTPVGNRSFRMVMKSGVPRWTLTASPDSTWPHPANRCVPQGGSSSSGYLHT